MAHIQDLNYSKAYHVIACTTIMRNHQIKLEKERIREEKRKQRLAEKYALKHQGMDSLF